MDNFVTPWSIPMILSTPNPQLVAGQLCNVPPTLVRHTFRHLEAKVTWITWMLQCATGNVTNSKPSNLGYSLQQDLSRISSKESMIEVGEDRRDYTLSVVKPTSQLVGGIIVNFSYCHQVWTSWMKDDSPLRRTKFQLKFQGYHSGCRPKWGRPPQKPPNS